MLNGLKSDEVKKNRELYGSNTLEQGQKNTFLTLLLESLGDPIIKILLVVLGVKTIFLFQSFDWFETLGIVIAILLASIISTISEYGSEKSFEHLLEESSKIKCRVIRDGNLREVDIDDVVKNDVVVLGSGDKVCADGIIKEGNITIDESSFTGEKIDVIKAVESTVYRGSVVLKGSAKLLVSEVGKNTKYGQIAKELLDKTPESPLKMKLRELANIISKIGYTGALLVFFSYLFSVIFVANNFNMSLIMNMITSPKIIFGHIIYALTLAVTIIIVSVPEGLPMMVALVLSSNMKRMIKEKVLVRRMVGIETAGRIDTLLTDKTGTITKGCMEVVGIVLNDGEVLRSITDVKMHPKISNHILDNMYYNNEAFFSNGEIIGGNLTDKAILAFCSNHDKKDKIIKQDYFDSTKKYSSVILESDKYKTLIKGAPDLLLPKINEVYTKDGIREKTYGDNIKKLIKKYTSLGYRVIVLAEKSNYLDTITFVSLVLLKDELNKSAKDATSMIKHAGVNIIMITGDALETATNIGKEIGLLTDDKDLVLTSRELSTMSDEIIKLMFDKIKVIARALPEDKSRLVRIAKEMGHIVGMTGDGVNDAPALKKADVGFAMGSGSSVAKEASDIVILDNNLLSISKSILYGRTIYKSIRKFIIFQLTMNLCALTLSIIGPFLGISTPVTVMQMLWINMIMDTLAGLAFSFEPPLLEYMRERPLKKNEPIINSYMYSSILITGLYTAILLILFLKLSFIKNLFRYDVTDKYLMTAFFGLFVFTGVFNAFNARTTRINLLSNITENKPFITIISFIMFIQIILLYRGGVTFRTFGLNLREFMYMILLSFTVIPVDMIRKKMIKKLKKC